MCMQTSSETIFRKINFWDKGGRDAPPVFNVDGVSYLYVKVTDGLPYRQTEFGKKFQGKCWLRKLLAWVGDL